LQIKCDKRKKKKTNKQEKAHKRLMDDDDDNNDTFKQRIRFSKLSLPSIPTATDFLPGVQRS
jgi:hypothetical protein